MIERTGCYGALHDRGSHYFFTPEAGGKVSKSQLTQVGRALKQLGIGHIAATRRRPGAAASAPSERCRTACPRSWRWPGSPPSRPPPVPARGLPARAQQDLRSRPRSRRGVRGGPRGALARRPRDPGGARRRQRQLRRLARPPAADPGRRRCARTWCAPGSGSTTIPTARSPSSKGPGAWRASRRTRRRRPRTWRVTTATRPALWICWTTLRVAHNPTGPTTAVNSCATYCGQNNALATGRSPRLAASSESPHDCRSGSRKWGIPVQHRLFCRLRPSGCAALAPGRMITKAQLLGMSLVTIPANPHGDYRAMDDKKRPEPLDPGEWADPHPTRLSSWLRRQCGS